MVIKNKDSKMAFCRAAYACSAIIEAFFPETGNDAIWVQHIPQEIRDQLRFGSSTSTYDVFEQFVCKLGLRGLLERRVKMHQIIYFLRMLIGY